MNNKGNLNSRGSSVRSIEADAFFNGVHGTPIREALAETKATFQKMIERVQRDSADEIKRLEGEIGAIRYFRSDAEERWTMFRNETAGKTPAFFVPAIAVVGALLAVPAEAWFLGPILQGWNITDPISQFIVAFVFVFSLGGLMKTMLATYKRTEKDGTKRNWLEVGMIVVLTVALAVWLGVFRANALAYDARLNTDLRGFLGESMGINLGLSILGTCILPFVATLALNYGFDHLRYWKQWSKARRDTLKFARLEEETEKKREAEVEKLEKDVAEIDAERNEWLSAQGQAHAEGEKLGASRRPLWEVLLPLIGAGVLITAITMLIAYLFVDERLVGIMSEGGRFALYLGVAFGIVMILGYWILKRWNSPSPKELYANRTVRWTGGTAPLSLRQMRPVTPVEAQKITPITPVSNQNGNYAKV